MRINNNISAMNTYSRLTSAQGAQAKSLEKLSSGLRINRAGDDAAGLAISEKMRGQIRGLTQASRNAQDGISLIQTAEGALNETHSILQRMRELAVQSSNDTNTNSDRSEIQKEMDELAKEITRISNNTEFNTQKLINGGISDDGVKAAKFHVGANANQDITLSIKAMDAKSLGVSRDVTTASVNAGAVDVKGVELSGELGTHIVEGTLNLTANSTAEKTAWTGASLGITGTSLASTDNSSEYNDYKITVTKTGTAGTDVSAAIDRDAKTITINYAADIDTVNGSGTAEKLQAALNDKGIALTATGAATAVAGTANASATTKGLAADEVNLTIGGETVTVKNTATSATFTSAENKGLTLRLDGSASALTNAAISIGKDSAAIATFSNGEKATDAKTSGGIDVSSQTAASDAITTIDDAISKVSAERSKLGAIQNRLDHTINNLTATSENLSAAESRIRDVDMAKEMMEFTKNNILNQASTAMLAQANQMPQGVLQLLG